jgi:hypothetical protein
VSQFLSKRGKLPESAEKLVASPASSSPVH